MFVEQTDKRMAFPFNAVNSGEGAGVAWGEGVSNGTSSEDSEPIVRILFSQSDIFTLEVNLAFRTKTHRKIMVENIG